MVQTELIDSHKRKLYDEQVLERIPQWIHDHKKQSVQEKLLDTLVFVSAVGIKNPYIKMFVLACITTY